MTNKKEILVLGAGVSGLSTGILLRKAGFDVHIWAKDFSPNVTSDIAAAIWFPYLAEPMDRVLSWSECTFRYLDQHVLHDPASGCRKQSMIMVFDEEVDDPSWRLAVEAYRKLQPAELPPRYADGYVFESILMDPSIYLGWLQKQFEQLGGRTRQKTITDITEAFAEYDTVVNCTGLASRELFGDKEVFPVRGQVVKVKPNGFEGAIVDEDGHNGLAYVIVRFNEIVLGGTAQPNNWSLEVDPKDTADILRKAKLLSPAFNAVEIIEEKVGLRPARKEVRLELEAFGDKSVVHNYGHGGAGFTLSWGCANEAVDIVMQLSSV